MDSPVAKWDDPPNKGVSNDEVQTSVMALQLMTYGGVVEIC